MIVGGVASLGTTLGLALMFLHSVIKRLAVLRDNARLYAEGKGLAAPLDGSDEVAEVDRAFHEMATNLDQQKQENEMFVYSVSHDLRSPLINLQGFSEELSVSYRELQGLFQHEEIPPAVRAEALKLMAENIDDSICYIQSAVGRLRELSMRSCGFREQAGWSIIGRSSDLQAMIRKIVDALQGSVASKKAEVVVRDLPRPSAMRPPSNRSSPT